MGCSRGDKEETCGKRKHRRRAPQRQPTDQLTNGRSRRLKKRGELDTTRSSTLIVGWLVHVVVIVCPAPIVDEPSPNPDAMSVKVPPTIPNVSLTYTNLIFPLLLLEKSGRLVV